MKQRFSHVAVTVPTDYLQSPIREEIVRFYETLFGWTENPALGIANERLLLRAPSDAQYLTIRTSKEPMQTSGYEHLGVWVESNDAIDELHGRAEKLAAEDSRVELTHAKTGYGGALYTFRVRFLLPLTIEVQHF